MQAQRLDARLDPDIMREGIRLCFPLFNTPATAGKPFGWQAEADWQGGIDTLLAAGAVKPGLKPGDFYTNEMIG
jgi:NitT/TauT family transport system substrate-binding protein